MSKLYIKRLFDIIVALSGLIILSPLLLLIMVTVKATSGRNIFFQQERVGLNGKVFKIIKFRTMSPARPEFSVEQTREFEKNGRDPRVTPVGYFLRGSGLDELPQLVNILVGDMSFVGPRPFYLPRYISNPRLKARLFLRPGLTSLSVVNGGVKLSDEDLIASDLEYINKQSFSLDLKVILKTISLYSIKLWEKKDLKIG